MKNNPTESARKLFAQECVFLRGMADMASMPPPGLPEFAFIGRSNVGKSSLINALVGRKKLARASNTPGRTQEINFFGLADRLILVDLPGYGWASTSQSKVEQWGAMVENYLLGRQTLRCVFVLVDARHGLKDTDRMMIDLLASHQVPFAVVLTKSDKVKGRTRDMVDDIAAQIPAQAVIATSAEKKDGIAELRSFIAGSL